MPLVCGCGSSRYGRGASVCGGICSGCCGFDLEAFCGMDVAEEWFTCNGIREKRRNGLSFASKPST